MLAQLLGSNRPLILFDLETTGLQRDEARIVELAHEVHRPDGTIAAFHTLVRPGVPLGASSAVHGISEADLLACQICHAPLEGHPTAEDLLDGLLSTECKSPKPPYTFIALAQNLARGYSNCDFAGKNIRYDLGVMAAEMGRAKVPWSFAGARILDADRLEAALEPRSLADLYARRIGRRADGAHRAHHDVRMTAEILEDQLRGGGLRARLLARLLVVCPDPALVRDAMAEIWPEPTALPRDLDALHEMSWPGWVDSEGKIRKDKDGVARLAFGKHRDLDVRRVPGDYWKFMLRGDFSEEVKGIVRGIIAGRIP